MWKKMEKKAGENRRTTETTLQIGKPLENGHFDQRKRKITSFGMSSLISNVTAARGQSFLSFTLLHFKKIRFSKP